jgi:hypothetical protein
MVRLRFFAPVLAVLVVCSILAAGCTGQSGVPQPPASTLTIPTTRPATPVPGTAVPVQTGTAASPATIPGVTPAPNLGTVTQAGSAILIQGDVRGFKSATGNYIDELQFSVVKAPRADPVTFDIPNTQISFTKEGVQFGVNYLPISGDLKGDRVLDAGETFLVRVPLPPQNVIYPGQMFTMAIQNPPNPRVVVSAQAPSVLTVDPMVLARAPA